MSWLATGLSAMRITCWVTSAARADTLEHMLANFRLPDQKFHGTFRFQVDQRVAARTVLARILWCQGFPEEAVRTAKGAIGEAREMNQALSLCFALGIAAAPIMLWIGDFAAAEQYIAMLVDHSARVALSSWGTRGRLLQSLCVVMRGDSGHGLRQLRTALDEYDAISVSTYIG
jgi:hypothetical protein